MLRDPFNHIYLASALDSRDAEKKLPEPFDHIYLASTEDSRTIEKPADPFNHIYLANAEDVEQESWRIRSRRFI